MPTLDQLRADQATLLAEAKKLKGKKSPEARRRAQSLADQFTDTTRRIKQKEAEDASTTTDG
jgi:hypothetical protein